jgi:hypothetical protein
MNPNRIPHNQLIRPNKKNLVAPRAGRQPQAHLSQSKGASNSPAAIDQRGVVDTVSGAMTTEELIDRAKRNIGFGEASRSTSFRAAAEDIARACNKGSKQRKSVEGVGNSFAWVNRLLKWLENVYVVAPFVYQLVQGVNKNSLPLAPTSNEPKAPTIPGKNEPAASPGLESHVDPVETPSSSGRPD